MTYIVSSGTLNPTIPCRVWQKDKLLLTIHDTSHFSQGNVAMCHGANKIQKKKLETSGFRKSEFRKLDRETSEFRKIQNSESGNWMLLGTL